MPTPKQEKLAKLIQENAGLKKPKTMGEMLVEAGYSEETAETPGNITKGKGFQELMDEYLPDDKVMEVHKGLLNSTKIEHMVFPPGPKHTEDIPLEGDVPEELIDSQTKKLSDDEIRQMIADIGCKVRKIVHGETARHVYYWAPDATARKSAVELAYKIKGRITNKVQLDAQVRTNPFGSLSTEELREMMNDDGNSTAT